MLIKSRVSAPYYLVVLFDKINAIYFTSTSESFFPQFFLILTARFVPGQDTTCSVFEAYNVQLKDIMPNFPSDLNSSVSFFQANNLSILVLLIPSVYRAVNVLLYILMVRMHYHSFMKNWECSCLHKHF